MINSNVTKFNVLSTNECVLLFTYDALKISTSSVLKKEFNDLHMIPTRSGINRCTTKLMWTWSSDMVFIILLDEISTYDTYVNILSNSIINTIFDDHINISLVVHLYIWLRDEIMWRSLNSFLRTELVLILSAL